MHQITRLTREKGCLTHDDRVEGLAGLINMMKDMLGLHPTDQADDAEERRIEEALKKLEEEEDWIQGGSRSRGGFLRGKLRSGRSKA